MQIFCIYFLSVQSSATLESIFPLLPMMTNPIGWVEIPVTDMDRAESFYRDFFGKTLNRQQERHGVLMSWIEPWDMQGYGSSATLIKGEGYTPSHEGSLVYFSAPEGTVDASLAKAKEQGIEVLQETVDIGEHGFYGVIEDTEGNRIAIHSMDG